MAAQINNLSSPSASPSYIPGAVSSVKPKQTAADYKKRLDNSYKAPPIKKKAPVIAPNTGTAAIGKEYQDLMNQYKGNLAKQRETAMQLYNKNKTALDADRNTSRNALTGQRGSDINDITEGYAARGIGRSSGVVQQSGVDYDTSLAERLKNIDQSYNKQAETEQSTQNASIKDATDEYTQQTAEATADAAKRKAAALEAAKKASTANTAPAKTTPKTVTKAAPKLVNGR